MTLGLHGAAALGQPATGGATGTPGTGTATGTGAATATATPPPTAPAAVSAPVTVAQAAYTDPGGNKAIIVDFVTRNLTNLMNDADTAAQTNARNNLSAATLPAGAPASPTFLFEYGKALNDAFGPKLEAKANATLRQRLNIAIVTAKVAYVADNVTLQATTLKLINDPAEPVMLWGLKAAQKQVPLILKVKAPGAKGPPPLLAAIAPAVFKHPSGPVFAEAYLALTAVDPLVYTELIKLWGNRLSQYQGKDAPDDPEVDGRPVFTLSYSEMWKTVLNNPAAQTKVMQMISDQTSVAAQWADKTPAGDKHDQLVKLVVQCAAACSVIGKNTKSTALEQAATGPSNLNVATMGAGVNMQNLVNPIIAAIKTAFPDVQAPPVVGQPGVALQP
jgi:adenosyl cobinamide kinase/adenosyl cobinamide phosphate guanylyltransferase